MKHELGNIKVEAEILEENPERVECLSDVTTRYSELGQKQKEHVYALFLDKGNHVIGDKLISLGNLGTASFDIQDVIRTASLVKAGATILIHNHPSGKPEATKQDIKTTQKVHEALEAVGTELLDHVIITHTDSYSMKQHRDGPFQK